MARPTKQGLEYFSQTGCKIRDTVLMRDGLKCIECDCEIDFYINSRKKISLIKGEYHHIVPRIYGGENSENNMCLLCTSCHLSVHSGRETSAKYYEMFNNYKTTGKLRSYGEQSTKGLD